MQKLTQRNKNFTSENKNLSIQFSLDGFSFCIKDAISEEIGLLSEYVFTNKLETPNLLLEKIKSIFESDKDLQANFKKVKAIHLNQLVTQVPNEYFDDTNLKSYLNYNIKTLASDYITYDNLQSIDAKNVFIPYVNINNFLFQNFGEFEFEHHSTILINQLIKKYENSSNDLILVNVVYDHIDVIVLKKGTFCMYNSFHFTTKEDFLYYILFSAEQLNLNLKELELIFVGNITKEFTSYQIISDYLKNISFLQPSYDFLDEAEHFFPHSNYILLS